MTNFFQPKIMSKIFQNFLKPQFEFDFCRRAVNIKL